jgi:hypothetical protein
LTDTWVQHGSGKKEFDRWAPLGDLNEFKIKRIHSNVVCSNSYLPGLKKLNKNTGEWVLMRGTSFVICLWFHSPRILN